MRALSENEASQQLQPEVEQHLLIYSVIEALGRHSPVLHLHGKHCVVPTHFGSKSVGEVEVRPRFDSEVIQLRHPLHVIGRLWYGPARTSPRQGGNYHDSPE